MERKLLLPLLEILRQQVVALKDLTQSLQQLKGNFAGPPDALEIMIQSIRPQANILQNLMGQRRKIIGELAASWGIVRQDVTMAVVVKHASTDLQEDFIRIEKTLKLCKKSLEVATLDCYRLLEFHTRLNMQLMEIIIPCSTYNSQGRTQKMASLKVAIVNHKG